MKINTKDYIVTEHFTKEEGEIFQQLMVDQGVALYEEANGWWGTFELFGCDNGNNTYFTDCGSSILTGKNLTKDFRKYLDNMNKRDTFTKPDLKDGMRIILRSGREYYVCGDEYLLSHSNISLSLQRYMDELTCTYNEEFDIVEVIDRDGTVVFKREEPKKVKLELELTEEQADKIKRELGL